MHACISIACSDLYINTYQEAFYFATRIEMHPQVDIFMYMYTQYIRTHLYTMDLYQTHSIILHV